ncbi:hypothetical protein EIP86_003211 [Pleurotus ostreatoroseus]|nr:hypothetical protein EIP86_003211 [Pleurotus ostreatoroseus]
MISPACSETLSPSRATTPDSRLTAVDEDTEVVAQTQKAIVDKLRAVIENRTVLADKLRRIRKVIYTVKTITTALSDACERQENCRDEALKLVEELDSFLLIESHLQALEEWEETRKAVEVMVSLIAETSMYILNQTSDGIIGYMLSSETQYEQRLAELRVKFARAKDAFDRSVRLGTYIAIRDFRQLEKLSKKLRECSDDAHFKSGEENCCLPATRVLLLDFIKTWIDDQTTSKRNVLWLHGKTGSGKSTVANTIAQMVERRGYNLSCFFCKRDDEKLSNPRILLPTLAYRFAEQHESYRVAVFRLLDKGTRGVGIASTADLCTQFERLFKELLPFTVDPLRPHVIIIDALDECGVPREQTVLAKRILEMSQMVPWIKVLVTSGPADNIRKVFSEDLSIPRNIDEESQADEDIRRYVVARAQSLQNPIELSESDIDRLAKRANGLFIWCSTLFTYLDGGLRGKSALNRLIAGSEDGASWVQLDELYEKVLRHVMRNHNQDYVLFMQTVLMIISIAADTRPLSAKAMAALLCNNPQDKGDFERDASDVVEKLHPVLYFDTSNPTSAPSRQEAPIRARHGSFYEFLKRNFNDAIGQRRETPEYIHGRMLDGCMRILLDELRFNICKIEVPVLNKDIQDLNARISEHMNEALQYATRFWFVHLSHLTSGIRSSTTSGILKLLASKRILFWLESLSLQGALRECLLAFEICVRLGQRSSNPVAAAKNSRAISSAAKDARTFVTSFIEAMDSVPHIYLSALFWLPGNSQTFQNLKLSRSMHGHLIDHRPDNWDGVVWVRSRAKEFCSVAYSPDGQLIATGTPCGCIFLWYAQTGGTIGAPLQGHNDKVLFVAFSPSGSSIISGSLDRTVRVWDVKTGENISTFEPPSTECDQTSLCIAFSPDGKYIALRVDYCVIQIWNIETGQPHGAPLQHTTHVYSAAYSPDGQYMATGGANGEIHIWSMGSRLEARRPFKAHGQFPVDSISYSPDGFCIVSASSHDKQEQTIRRWNAETGQSIGRPMRRCHARPVLSARYSPKGQFIVSTSSDHTIRVWDATSGSSMGIPLRDCSSDSFHVAFSPDECFIVSASSDKTIRLWNMPTRSTAQDDAPERLGPLQTIAFSPDSCCVAVGDQEGLIHIWSVEDGASPTKTLRGHTARVRSVVYSPDGRFIASGSDDRTVRIWNLRTGTTIRKEHRGQHRDTSVLSVAYSPDGRIVASASGLRSVSVAHSGSATVCLWTTKTGAEVCEPLPINSNAALSVAFSKNKHLACGSSLGTVHLWDVSSGAPVPMRTLSGHSAMVSSLAFSPKGSYLASGCSDGSIRVWGVQTGVDYGPVQGSCHTNAVLSVAFSPCGRFIASSSRDHTVRIWDAESGWAVGRPIRGHTRSVTSVAYSLDGSYLASCSEDRRIHVYDTSALHQPRRKDAEARWLTLCSQMSRQDGWVKDGQNLLLWVPVPYRHSLQSGALFAINSDTPKPLATYSVDYETLFKYSGKNWTKILSEFVD